MISSKINFTWLPLLSLVFLLSCSKKTEPIPEIDDPFKNLVDKYYILEASFSKPAYPVSNGAYVVDIYNDYYKDPCLLDDLKMFTSEGNYIFDNGATKCHPMERQSSTSKWRFVENNSVIQIYNLTDQNTNNLKILVNNGVTLKYEMKVKGSDKGVIKEYTWTETWKKYP